MRLFVWLILTVAPSLANAVWRPMCSVQNKVQRCGLVFYFDSPPSTTAFVTVTAEVAGKAVSVGRVIETDPRLGGTLFKIPGMDNLDAFKVEAVTIEFTAPTK